MILQVASGVYSIRLANTEQIKQVWCDMDTDGDGWTVFLKRINGSVDFYQVLATYSEGFGDVNGEYWLARGLEALHTMTTAKTYQVRADISDWAGEFAHSLHASMAVANASDDYRLTVGDFRGGGGGGLLTKNHNMRFSTKDADRDMDSRFHCAERLSGGFWYNKCTWCNPTGVYYIGGAYTHPDHGTHANNGIQWRSWSIHDLLRMKR